MTPEQLDRLAVSLRAGDYSLLLGAAASLGSQNASGRDLLLANDFRLELCRLKGAKEGHSLQRIYQTLDADEVELNVTKRFSGCVPGAALKAIPSFLWKRIFTLNVDDALEAAYAIGDPYQIPEVKNFRDPFEEIRESSRIPIIHLHGFVQRPNDGYIFSKDSYLQIIKSANPWMVVLAQLLSTEPFIIMGSSLDEIDLDYFLSLRSQATARSDRGPSILIEPFGDIVTDKECDRLDLVRFPGTAEEFMEFLSAKIMDRPRPHELVAPESRAIFIEEPTTHDLSRFFSDFEKVPVATEVNTHDPKFFFGHTPTWSDLSLQYDIARPANVILSRLVNSAFSGSGKERLIILSDVVGLGKSTSLKRVGFDFARQGTIVLSCSAIGRLEPRFTASMLDNIAGRCLILVDDFADQVYSIEQILQICRKSDLVFLAAERSYRIKFLREVLSGTDFKIEGSTDLSVREALQLIDTYFAAGLVGDESFVKNQEDSAKSLKDEPIAVACCRILNDLRPLDRIVSSLLLASTRVARLRYLAAALAQYCTKAGVRIDLLIAASSGAAISEQFNSNHALPLTYSEESGRNYVIPLNGTIASRILEVTSDLGHEELFHVFVSLGRAVAPRVNRKTIVQRSPEARLAARLFDLDQVVERFLGDRAEEFYEAVEDEWRWNSRYWEQVALLNFYKSQRARQQGNEGSDALDLAVAHARHAVSIERHPLTLTTLAKILFGVISETGRNPQLLGEAIDSLSEAIGIERRRNRSSVQPYVVMFQGILSLSSLDDLREKDLLIIKTHLVEAQKKFSRDAEVRALIGEVKARME